VAVAVAPAPLMMPAAPASELARRLPAALAITITAKTLSMVVDGTTSAVTELLLSAKPSESPTAPMPPPKP
jgi:hypothetical protein